MLCVDAVGAPTSRRKEFCPECGLPRDPVLAKTLPCGACGTYGTQKRSPQFDDMGERVPDAVVEQRTAERIARLQQGRLAKRTAQQALVEDHPTSDAAKAVKLVQRMVRAKAAPAPVAAADTFTLLMMED